jgi:hypothetical protein
MSIFCRSTTCEEECGEYYTTQIVVLTLERPLGTERIPKPKIEPLAVVVGRTSSSKQKLHGGIP